MVHPAAVLSAFREILVVTFEPPESYPLIALAIWRRTLIFSLFIPVTLEASLVSRCLR